MGEKGNAIEGLVPDATSVVERTTTVATDATGHVIGVARDEATKIVAGAAMGAAGERLRGGKDDDEDEDEEPKGKA
jgi:hypothetical protein